MVADQQYNVVTVDKNQGPAQLDQYWVVTKPVTYSTNAYKDQIKLLMITCGKKDGLIRISQGVHAYLKENDVPHTWHVDGNAHDPTHWRNSLYHFAQRIFR